MTVIDIGANVGDAVAQWRSVGGFKILAVEADPSYYALLEENVRQYDGAECECMYVGARDAQFAVKRDRASGTGMLVAAEASKEAVKIETLDSLTKRRNMFADAKLVKIATDGYDTAIIEGAERWLRTARPPIFFEYYPALVSSGSDGARRLFDLLQKVGYAWLIFFEHTGSSLVSVASIDKRLIDDLHEGVRPGRTRPYCDVCAIHFVDAGLVDRIRAGMLAAYVDVGPGA